MNINIKTLYYNQRE